MQTMRLAYWKERAFEPCVSQLLMSECVKEALLLSLKYTWHAIYDYQFHVQSSSLINSSYNGYRVGVVRLFKAKTGASIRCLGPLGPICRETRLVLLLHPTLEFMWAERLYLHVKVVLTVKRGSSHLLNRFTIEYMNANSRMWYIAWVERSRLSSSNSLQMFLWYAEIISTW